MEIEKRVLELKKKLEKKRGCKLNPPMPLEELQKVEETFGITLPEEYRQFLLLAGNGGIVPPFTEECNELLPFPTDPQRLERLKTPFPLEKSELWEEDTEEDGQDFDADERMVCSGVGLIPLMQDETDEYGDWLLVVNGPAKGDVWLSTSLGVMRLTGCTFLDWLELHLNKKLQQRVKKAITEHRKQRDQRKGKAPEDYIARAKRIINKLPKKYGYQWNPPISMEEVRAFEEKHNVTLPSEYVRFITEVADGGRDEDSESSWIMHSLHEFDDMEGLSKPFPFQNKTDCDKVPKTKYSLWGESFWNEWSLYFPDCSLPEQISDTWLMEQYAFLSGTLPLITHIRHQNNKLNSHFILVLNGDFQGKVWIINSYRYFDNVFNDFFNYFLSTFK